jgi:N-acetyl-anhydromuramoyl-L-alanine amidase
MKFFELLLLALALYYFLILRPKAIKEKKRRQEVAKKSKASKEASTPSSPIVEKMVACDFCKVRLPDGDAIMFDGRFYCCQTHLKAINAEGFLGGCKRVLSNNYDLRPDNVNIDTIVIHHISLPEGKFGGHAIEDFFCNRLNPKDDPYYPTIIDLQVSAHFLIKRSGELIQFVSTLKRAWHAGASSLMERQKCNDFSIGIELEGTGDLPFESEQYHTLHLLIQEIQVKHPIQMIVGHSDIAPGRKTDPGKCFDWQYFKEISGISETKFPFGISSR